MNNKMWISTTALVVGTMLVSGSAMAQSAEHQELRNRIEVLEAKLAEAPGRPKLAFNVGEGTTIELYGFVRTEAFYDFDFNQGDFSSIGALNAGNETDGEFNTSVRVSRFGIRSKTESGIGTIGTQLEFDLFGSGGDESTSPNLRLRHANVTIGDNWLFGQTWTNFMPLGDYPRSADFNGPVGITFARVAQARYSNSTSYGLDYSVSVEESVAATSNAPVFTAAAGYSTDRYSVRAAALTGRVNNGASGDLGYSAYTLSGSITPWEGGSFGATYVNGDAIGSLLIGGGDDIVGNQTNDAEGFTLEFRQQIGDKWNVGAAYGNENYANAGASNLLDAQSLHVNAFYSPTDNLSYGLEYIMLERENGTGESLKADRIGASVTFSF